MDNPRAFPKSSLVMQDGMTLRDYFAAKALQGMLCNGFMPDQTALDRKDQPFDYVLAAYELADAMLKERER